MSVSAYIALAVARTRPNLAAAGLAMSTIKPTFGVPLAMLMLARADCRAVGVGLLLSALFATVPIAIIANRSGGFESLLELLHQAHSSFLAVPVYNPTSSVTRIDAFSLLGRFLGHSPGALPQVGVTIAMLAVGALAVRRITRSGHSGGRLCAGTLICLTVLCCVYHQVYCGLLLALPLTALLTNRDMLVARSPLWRWTLAFLLAVPTLNLFSLSPVLNFIGAAKWWNALSSMNAVSLLFAWVIYVAPSLRAGGRLNPATAG